MREPNLLRKVMPHMEWSPRNLYLLWRRSHGPEKSDTSFTRTRLTLFQQRWKSKALVRAYHGDHIPEKIFKRWYLPSLLPDVRPRRPVGDDRGILERFAQRETARKKEEEVKGMAPVGSLMFSEVERRIDVFIFRCCFAHSVYEARRLVIHGDVLLNGKKHQNANTRLAPGDMVSVDPKAIRFLRADAAPNPESDATKDAAQESSQEKTARSSAIGEKNTSKCDSDNKDATALTPFHLPAYASPFIFIPAYIEPSFATCSAIYVRHPTARPGYSEIPTPYDADGEVVRLAWEWYSKTRPRIRSKSQLARMPENRQEQTRVYS